MVACDDEPLGPSFGSITVELVATDPAPPPAPPAAAPEDTSLGVADDPQEARKAPTTNGRGSPEGLEKARPDHDVDEDAETVLDGESPVGSPALSPRGAAVFDAVTVRVEGPTNKNASLVLVGENWVGTVDGLEPGSYTVTVQGTTGGEVTYFGTTPSVNVVRGQNTTASVPWNTFQPALGAVPAQTLQAQVGVTWGAITGATGYEFQWADNPDFSSPQSSTGTATSATAGPVGDAGMHYVRVKASNDAVSNGAWSEAASFEVLTDTIPSGSDQADAPDLGFAPTVDRTGLNILPTGDTDWFAVQACVLDTLFVDVLAQQLSPASALDSYLEIKSADGQVVLAENDDAVGTDSHIEMELGESGVFNIVVSGAGNTVGYYELSIQVTPGPANTGSDCSIVTQVPTTISVAPAGAALSSIGNTQDYTVEVRDQMDWPISPSRYVVEWAALNPDVATAPGGSVPGTEAGTLTAERDGQVIVQATAIENGGAWELSGYAVLTVTDPGAEQANVFDSLPAPAGAYTLGSWGASASDIWASGMDNSISYQALMHYDGASWTMDPAINGTPSAPVGYLWGIWGASPTDIYAVGGQGDLLHYDGTWAVVVPTTGLELLDVWVAAPNDVHVAGMNGLYHWDGAVWDTAYAAADDFWDVWGTAANDVWAVTQSGNTYHYDGSVWSLHTTLSDWYADMWGAGPEDIWACGATSFAHWDGNSWSEEATPLGSLCLGIWGTSSSDIYATSLSGELAHYDGNGWAEQDSGTGESLREVLAIAPDRVWALGSNGTLLRYDGSGWSPESSGTTEALIAAYATGPEAVWVLGDGGTVLHYDGADWYQVL